MILGGWANNGWGWVRENMRIGPSIVFHWTISDGLPKPNL